MVTAVNTPGTLREQETEQDLCTFGGTFHARVRGMANNQNCALNRNGIALT